MPHSDPLERQRYSREYKRANRWRYARRQKALDAARHANARALVFGCVEQLSVDEVAAILDTERCALCGEFVEYADRELDHAVALSRGGSNRPENVRMACGPCNARKAEGTSPGQWAEDHDACVRCGTTDRPHAARGHCARCHQAVFVTPFRQR